MEQKRTELLFSKNDYEIISGCLGRQAPSQTSEALEEELSRARVLESLPPGVVGLYSTVSFLDHTSGKIRRVTIVTPGEANPAEGKVSFLAPVGAALIGLSAGQSIEWKMPVGNKRKFEVLSVFSGNAELLSARAS